MNDSTLVLIVLGVVALVVVLAVWEHQARVKRRRALAAFATRHGLAFDQHDPLNLLSLPFAVFTSGNGRGIENVMQGRWHDLAVTAFDYWYYTQTHTGKGGTVTTYYHFNCVIAPIDADCPHLSIGREDFFTRLKDHMGFKDTQFELEAFNRLFEVKGDRKLAIAFCDQAMMEWLLANGNDCAFEIVADKALVVFQQVEAEHLPAVLERARAFHKQVPRVVSSLYPPKV